MEYTSEQEEFVREKSDEIIQKINRDGVPKPVAFDPTSLLLIAGLIISVFQLFQGCSLFGRDAEKRLKNPGLFDRLRLRRLVSQELYDTKLYPYRDEVMMAILKIGYDIKTEQVELMLGAK